MSADIGAKIGIEGEAAFRNSLKMINSQMKTLGAEMKAVVAEFSGMEKSEEAISRKSDVLGRSISAAGQKIELLSGQAEKAKRKLSDLASELEKAEKEFGANSKEAEELRRKYAAQYAEVNRLEQQIFQTTAEMKKMEKAMDSLGKEADSASDAMGDMGGEMSGGMSKADAFSAVLGGTLAAGGLQLVAEKAIEATAAIAEFAVEADKAMKLAQAQTGVEGLDAKAFNSEVVETYSAGIAESMEEAADAVAKVKMQMRDLPTDQLDAVANKGLILEKVFGIDMQEGLRGADALMKQFGVDADTAYDLMTKGAQNGLNQNGDLADQLAEYSVYYKDAGYSIEQMFAAMQAGADAGVYSIDYLNDAIKEFGIRTKDNSKSSRDAFTALGLNADKMFQMFAAGGTQASEATRIVNEALFHMDDQVKQNEIGVALYGTKWEDVGIGVVQAVATASEGLEGVAGATEKAGEALTSSFAGKMQKLKAEVQAAFIELANEIITPEEFETRMTEIMLGLVNTVEENAPALMEKGFDMIVGLGNAIGDAAPQIVPTLVNLIKNMALTLIDNLPELMAVGPKLMGGLIIGLINAIPDLLFAIPEIIISIVRGFKEHIDELNRVGEEIIEGIVTGIWNAAGRLFGAFKDLLNGMIDKGKEELDINSPSKEAAKEIAAPVVEGIVKQIKKDTPKAEKAMAEMSKDILDAAKKWVDDKKFYNDLTLQEELAFWEEMKRVEGLSVDEIAEIDKKIYTAKESILKEEKKLMEEYQKSVESRAAKIRDFVGLFDEVKNEEVDGGQLIKNLEDQISAIEAWRRNMDELMAKGVSGDLLQELQGMGVDAAAEIAALNSLTEAELDKYISLFEEKGRIANEQAQKELAPTLLENAAQNVLDGLSNTAITDAANIGVAVTQAVAAAVTAASKDMSAANMNQTITGMDAQKPVLEEYLTETKDEMLELIESFYGEIEDSGREMMEAYADGIRAGKSAVVNAIAAVIAAAVSEADGSLSMARDSGEDTASYQMMQSRESFSDFYRMTEGQTMLLAKAERNMEQNAMLSHTYSEGRKQQRETQTQQTSSGGISFGDINLNIDKVDASNAGDVERLATNLEFYIRQKAAAKGGTVK